MEVGRFLYASLADRMRIKVCADQAQIPTSGVVPIHPPKDRRVHLLEIRFWSRGGGGNWKASVLLASFSQSSRPRSLSFDPSIAQRLAFLGNTVSSVLYTPVPFEGVVHHHPAVSMWCEMIPSCVYAPLCCGNEPPSWFFTFIVNEVRKAFVEG